MKDIIKIKDDVSIWFTADTHYEHVNITYGESNWDDKETNCRKFDTTKEMSQHIVKQINKYVKKDDILIHLGDWSFGGINNIWNFRKQLDVDKIIMTVGNHDNHIRNDYILPNVYRSIPYGQDLKDGIGIWQTDDEYPDYVTAQSLFYIIDDYLEIEARGYMFCCMHYPIEEWNNRYRNSFMLHGHSHGRITGMPMRLDVGMDNIYNMLGEYRPISIEEVIKILKKKK